MNNFKKISLLVIIIFILVTNVPSFTSNIIKQRQLKNEYEQLENSKEDIQQNYDEIVEEGKQDQYYREKYSLSLPDDVLFEFPEE